MDTYEWRPTVNRLLSDASRVVNRTRIELDRRRSWAGKMSRNLKVLTVLFTLCYIKLYAHIQNCWMTSTMHNVVISWYCIMFKLYWRKKNLFGTDYRHVLFLISARFKLLLWSDKNTFSGKSFNEVSLRVSNTWPPNCAHIILSNLCRIACVILRTVVSFLEVIQLVLQTCVMFGSTYLCELLLSLMK
jgi:hypothetical protein